MDTRFVAAVALAAVVLGAGAANAADLPARMHTKAPIYTKAAPVEVFSWTGFYVGANLGIGSAHASSNIMTIDTSQTLSGVLGGGQVGYNWQSGNWVFGVALERCRAPARDATWNGTVGGGGTVDQPTSLPWFMTARGRVGYAFAPMWMVYVTGGGAWGEVKVRRDGSPRPDPAPPPGTPRAAVRVIGAGVEGAINRHWSWKAEYLHVDLGSGSTVLFGIAPASLGVTNDIGRVGVNSRL